jgi:hypothetical protein
MGLIMPGVRRHPEVTLTQCLPGPIKSPACPKSLPSTVICSTQLSNQGTNVCRNTCKSEIQNPTLSPLPTIFYPAPVSNTKTLIPSSRTQPKTKMRSPGGPRLWPVLKPRSPRLLSVVAESHGPRIDLTGFACEIAAMGSPFVSLVHSTGPIRK